MKSIIGVRPIQAGSFALALGVYVALCMVTSAKARADEMPVFKLQCADIFMPPEGEVQHLNFTIPIMNGNQTQFATPSKPVLQTHSHFNWLIRRKNNDSNPTAANFKKISRQKTSSVGAHLGAGVTEQTWSHLYENVLSYSQTLFEANFDQFTAEEKTLVQRIFGAMYLKQGLQFVSENEKPGMFDQTGPHRLAVTGSTPGSTVYINDRYTSLFNLQENRDKFTQDIEGMGSHPANHIRGSLPSLNPLLEATKKEQMAMLFGLLIHEFGHHLGIKDTADRPLDQIGAKFEKLILTSLQEVDFSLINQPWIRLRTLNLAPPSATAVEGKLYFAEPGDLYDLTPEVKNRTAEVLGQKIDKIWTYNVRIEGIGTFDGGHFATPVSVMADVVALLSNGEFVTVPVRLVHYIAPAQAMRFLNVRENWWQYTNGQLQKTGEEALLSMEVLKTDAKPGIALQPNSKIDIVTASFDRSEYKAGDTAQFHLELPPMDAANLNSLDVELTSDSFVQSGGIKKVAFHLSPTGVQKLANGNYAVSFQWPIPANTKRSLRMKIRRISTKMKNETVTFRSAKELAFTIVGGKSQAKLISYGSDMRRVLEVPKVYPQPFLAFNMPSSAAIPLEYRFKGGAPLSIKLSGTVSLKGDTATENSGFVIDLMAKDPHPLLESREIQRHGEEVIVRIRFRVPKLYNQHSIEHVMINSVYFMDQGMDEVFENAVIGIKPQ